MSDTTGEAGGAAPAEPFLSFNSVSPFSSSHLRWFSSINWHKLRMSQLDAPTVRLIRKASQ